MKYLHLLLINNFLFNFEQNNKATNVCVYSSMNIHCYLCMNMFHKINCKTITSNCYKLNSAKSKNLIGFTNICMLT